MNAMELPHAADLLDIARMTLLEEILPQLSGDVRFKALMVANAMAIAGRAAAGGPIDALPEAARLCANIRAGRHDDDAALAAVLVAHAEARCRISSKQA
jgi:hypothetical protein